MSHDIDTINARSVESATNEKKSFTDEITRLNALACNFAQRDNVDLAQAVKQSKGALKVLGADEGVQEMLVAQMLSNHNLQQLCMSMANRMLGDSKGQYYINAAIKLCNSFTQQAALLAKLQGAGEQRIVVEHVEVHQGGQAIVGTITRGVPIDVKK